MGSICDQLFQFFSKWYTPQTLVIIDWRVGFLSWVLRLSIFAYMFYEIWLEKKYRLTDVPTAFPVFWFQASTSSDLQNSQNGSSDFCGNSEYDYWYSNDSTSYWIDLNAGCVLPQLGQMVTREAQSAFVTTYMKQLHIRSWACPGVQTACEFAGNGFSGRDQVDTIVTSPTGETTCTCSKLNDYFVLGADSLQLWFDHSFQSRTEQWSVSGSTKRQGSTEFEKSITTCVRRCGKRDAETGQRQCDDGCHWEFQPGQSMNASISEWLSVAGYSLDERLEGVVKPSQHDNQLPYRRMVGARLIFNLRYEGDVEDVSRPFKCEIEVDVVDDWTSLGSEISYAAYEGPFGDNEFYDHYRRGIMVQFFPAGHVYKTDPYTLIMTIIAGLVMLGVANFITGLVAFYCLKESTMYSAATYETFNPARRLAKFGLNAAMVCQLFNMLNNDNSDKEISEKELQRAFKGNFSSTEAEKLARAVLSEAHRSGALAEQGHALTVEALVELMTSDEVTLSDLGKLADTDDRSCCVFPCSHRGEDAAGRQPSRSALPVALGSASHQHRPAKTPQPARRSGP
jgi:hypothetical protein